MIWIDAQTSPAIANWITVNFPVTAKAVLDVGLSDVEDALESED
jgi:predicted nuclease of predicted toxin-antitoxin system